VLTFFASAIVLMVMFFRLNAYNRYWPNDVLLSPVSLFLRVDAIMIGCLLAMHTETVLKLVKRSKYFFGNPVVLLLLLMLFNYQLIPDLNIKYNLHLGFLIVPMGIGSSAGLLTNCIIALIIVVSIESRGRWYYFLNLPVMNYIGRLSYSLYLWQQMFFSASLGVLSRLPYAIIGIFATANFSFYLIEKPFLKVKDRYHRRKAVLLYLQNKRISPLNKQDV
jgi:peptidoglycan/LPS O-acetylase OafA/YrhL